MLYSKRKIRHAMVYAAMPSLMDRLRKVSRPTTWERITPGTKAQAQGVGAGAKKAMYACGYNRRDFKDMETTLAYSGADIPNSRVSKTGPTKYLYLKAKQRAANNARLYKDIKPIVK